MWTPNLFITQQTLLIVYHHARHIKTESVLCLGFFYNPAYIISSEPWLICFYTWSYQWPASIEICAPCWLLDQCVGRYLISWTQNELPVSFQKDKWRRVAFLLETINVHCAGELPGWQDERQTSARNDSLMPKQCSCNAVSVFTEIWGWRRQRWAVRVRTVVLCCTNWCVLTPRCRPHRCMSCASSDSSSLVVTGTTKSCCKAPTRPVTRSDR